MVRHERMSARRSGGRRKGPPRRRRRRGPGRGRRRRPCQFCVDKVEQVDYKDPDLLRPFLTDRGKIKSRRKTSLCAKHQRRLSVAVKRGRHLALLQFSPARVRAS
ncbi:MAG: 30S ribosomal protein S18 [Anaerolineae bacterium]